MLFRKKIPPCCGYCQRSAKIDDDMVLCSKKGIRPIYSKCRGFRYDPCKRIPPKATTMDFSKYRSEDFSL